MNTNEFVDAVATEARLTKTQAREVIDAVFTAVTKGLVAGEKINVSGFGTFEVKPEGGLNYRKIVPPKSCIEKNNIKLDLNFPTGEIIISDMIRIADFQKLIEYNGEDKYNSEKSLASSAGKILLTKRFAKEHNMAYLSLSNSSPNIF